MWDEIEAESTGLVQQVAFTSFAILVLLSEQHVVVVQDMVRDEVVDDACHLVGGGGYRLRSAEASSLAAKVISERGATPIQRLGCHA